MKAHLPVAVLNMMENGTWSGVSLIQLSSDVTKPTCDELAQNHCLLKPLVLSFPKAVFCPSLDREFMSFTYL